LDKQAFDPLGFPSWLAYNRGASIAKNVKFAKINKGGLFFDKILEKLREKKFFSAGIGGSDVEQFYVCT
jgi:hypothetical protein